MTRPWTLIADVIALWLIKHRVLKTYGYVEVYPHAFLNFELNGGEWSTSRLAALPPGNEPPAPTWGPYLVCLRPIKTGRSKCLTVCILTVIVSVHYHQHFVEFEIVKVVNIKISAF
jgi:hypothetical protein